MRIVIDAMGGDHAPASTVEGAIAAATEWADTQIVLVGDETKIEPLLSQSGARPANLSVRHASEVIGSDDEPVKAVRRKKGFFHGCSRTYGQREGSRRHDLGREYRGVNDGWFACCRPDGRN